MASLMRAGARGAVVTGTGLTAGSGVGSYGMTLGEGRSDNTGGPGKVSICMEGIAKPSGEGAGRLGELKKITWGNARRGGGGLV
jgi:hypothetical protein